MGAKRALVVDDSKSARLLLARALEEYDIEVDSAESAEAAIEYLSGHRPDVIFMDHLMPGMDGLQAVQHIKNDPRTATIPIMMYTSQEGELYLGQARALGAVGVLPKQIRPADVSKVLYELHLVPERRTEEQSSFTAVNVQPAEPGSATPAKPLTEGALAEQLAALRRTLLAGLDTQTDHIIAELRALVRESPAPAAVIPPPRAAGKVLWLAAGAALLSALIGMAVCWRAARLLDTIEAGLVQMRELDEHTRSALVRPGSAAATPAPESAATAARAPAAGDVRALLMAVPYGGEALGGARLETLSRFLYRLARQKVAGVVDVRTYAGRFCLLGNALDRYSLAPEETLFSRCDVVGNPSDDALTPAQRTPLALANLIGDVRAVSHGALQVQVAAGDAASVLAPYPPVSTDLTAGDWNRAAAANNRVEARLR